jgi:hypothetical protein
VIGVAGLTLEAAAFPSRAGALVVGFVGLAAGFAGLTVGGIDDS